MIERINVSIVQYYAYAAVHKTAGNSQGLTYSSFTLMVSVEGTQTLQSQTCCRHLVPFFCGWTQEIDVTLHILGF